MERGQDPEEDGEWKVRGELKEYMEERSRRYLSSCI